VNHLYIKEDHWGDWLFFSRDDDNSGRSAVTSKKLIAQAFYCYSTKLLIKSATALGYVEDANKYSKLYAKLVNAFNNEFVTKNGMLVSDSQTAYVLALKFNLLSKENIKVATERLVNNINDYGHLTTGFLGTPFLCHVLSDNGKNKEAIKLLLREEYPSWLYPVTKGATTIWERWNGIKPDGSFQYPSMNSFNHYAYGAIGEWMYNNLMGLKINQDFPGYKRFTIQPLFDENFDNISGTYNSNYGNIKVNWSRKNDTVLINISIPPNSQSDVFLSKPYKGNWTFNNMKAEGSVLEKKDDTDKTYFLLGSGDYQLRLKTE
jgi:alpha-L-rhamnosidase